jgi:hypothetical protein
MSKHNICMSRQSEKGMGRPVLPTLADPNPSRRSGATALRMVKAYPLAGMERYKMEMLRLET